MVSTFKGLRGKKEMARRKESGRERKVKEWKRRGKREGREGYIAPVA